jgi:hypothetical protein
MWFRSPLKRSKQKFNLFVRLAGPFPGQAEQPTAQAAISSEWVGFPAHRYEARAQYPVKSVFDQREGSGRYSNALKPVFNL